MGKKEGKKKEEERRRGKKERKAGMHRATNPRKSFVATGKKEMASILRNIRKRIKKKKTLPRKKPVTFYFFFFFFQDKDLESRDLQKYHKKKKERSTTKTYATKLNYISLKLTKQKCRNISKKKNHQQSIYTTTKRKKEISSLPPSSTTSDSTATVFFQTRDINGADLHEISRGLIAAVSSLSHPPLSSPPPGHTGASAVRLFAQRTYGCNWRCAQQSLLRTQRT